MKILLVVFTLFGLIQCSGRYLLLEQAEEYSRQGQYEEAISTYREHIAWRLSLEDRPAWENPYFYLLLIGDLQLAQDKLDDAIVSFEMAEAHGVEKSLVSDRYRYTASLLEKQGDLKRALEVLAKYRDRDPMLYDLIMDRVSKEQVRREDSPTSGAPQEIRQ